jgi:hypothetical protein
MTTYFSIKLDDATQSGIDELLRNLDSGTTAPQHDLHTRVSLATADAILKNIVEDMMDRFDGGEGAGILHTLLNMLKGATHVLLKQLLGKTDNAEVARLSAYLRDRRVVINNEVRFGFALPADIAASFASLFDAIKAGQGKENRAALNELMQKFADLAVARYLDDFMAPMDLGFIKRKAAELGRGTINKGVHVALNKLVPSLGQKELEIFQDFFSGMIAEG